MKKPNKTILYVRGVKLKNKKYLEKIAKRLKKSMAEILDMIIERSKWDFTMNEKLNVIATYILIVLGLIMIAYSLPLIKENYENFIRLGDERAFRYRLRNPLHSHIRPRKK